MITSMFNSDGQPRMVVVVEGIDDIATFVYQQRRYANRGVAENIVSQMRGTWAGREVFAWLAANAGLDLSEERDDAVEQARGVLSALLDEVSSDDLEQALGDIESLQRATEDLKESTYEKENEDDEDEDGE